MTRRLLENSLPDGWDGVTEGAAVVKTATGVTGATLYTGPAAGEVTNEMLRDSPALSLMGRSLDTPGTVEDILSVADNTVFRRYDNGGVPALGFGKIESADLSPQSILNEALRNSTELSVIGRSLSTAGTPGDILSTVNNTVLKRYDNLGTPELGFGKIDTADINLQAVTDATLRDSAALSVIGRSLNTAGTPADIAATTDNTVFRRYDNGGTPALGFGKIEAADLDSQAIGVDPVFGTDNEVVLSVTNVTPVLVPAGIWYAYAPFRTTIYVFIDAAWRPMPASSTDGNLTFLVVSDGTNVRVEASVVGPTNVNLRRVYP